MRFLLLLLLVLMAAADPASAQDPVGQLLAAAGEDAPGAAAVLRRLADAAAGAERPEVRTANLEAQAELLWLLGRGEEALAVLRSLPDSPERRLQQARLLLEMGEAGEVEGLLKDLAGREPAAGEEETAAQALYLLAASQLAAGRPEQAEPLLQKLQERYPQSAVLPAALLARCEALRALGKAEAARTVLEELEARFPSSPELALARPPEGGAKVRYASVPGRLLNPGAAPPPAPGTPAAPAPETPPPAVLPLPVPPAAEPALAAQASAPPPAAVQAPPGKALVQVGSFRDLENAQFLARDLKQRGFDARIVERTLDAQLYYRVLVGQEQSVESAQQALLRLKDAGYEGFLLLQE